MSSEDDKVTINAKDFDYYQAISTIEVMKKRIEMLQELSKGANKLNYILISRYSNAKIVIFILSSIIVLTAMFTFLSPVDVKVGDVCLSCWGK